MMPSFRLTVESIMSIAFEMCLRYISEQTTIAEIYEVHVAM